MHRNFSFSLLHCYSAMDVLQMQMQHCNIYQNNQDLSLMSGSDILPIYWSCRASAIYDLPINLRYIHKRVPALVIMHPLMQAIWGHIWKHTVEKSQTNATSVTMLLLGQTSWEHISKDSMAFDFASSSMEYFQQRCHIFKAVWC